MAFGVGRLVVQVNRMVRLIWNQIISFYKSPYLELKAKMQKCAQNPGKGLCSRKSPILSLLTAASKGPTRVSEQACRAALGFAASAQKGASLFHQKPSSRPLLHFSGGFISLMQSICICWFCHLSDVWLVCFELHYRLECNCGKSIFILLRVAANHSYMLQRIYNCLVLYVCVFNCIWEILWGRICIILNL